MTSTDAVTPLESGASSRNSDRFAFGANWRAFLSTINDNRIAEAKRSLADMLGAGDLTGRRFLDIGCGSGLFSLAAWKMGARVHSFDFDPLSVWCAEELRRRYTISATAWSIERGSVLDSRYLEALGTFDIVYSWGVLHHTGEMWAAVERAADAVAPNGLLFIAIYNDQGPWSVLWTRVKRTYNRLPAVLRTPYLLGFGAALEAAAFASAMLRLDPGRFVTRWTRYDSVRGMSRWHDVVDWIGGYPFEVASPEQMLEFCRARGFELIRLRTCGGKMGCNEFVFHRTSESSAPFIEPVSSSDR